MATLQYCIASLKVADNYGLPEDIAAYERRGMSKEQATVQAVEDALANTESEFGRISKDVLDAFERDYPEAYARAMDRRRQAQGEQDANAVSPAGVSGPGAAEDSGARPVGNQGGESLDAGLAGDGQGAAGQSGVLPGAVSAGRTGKRGAGRVDGAQSGDARGDSAGRSEPGAAGDFRLDAEAAGQISERSQKQIYRDNIAAIKVLKTLESEQRASTPDERKILAKYAGWGAVKGVFDPQNKSWAKEHQELKGLLTEAEWAAAARSMLDAHYTSPTVVQAMYTTLERLGFTGGRVLEPSVGAGNFFGLMPQKMRDASQLFGVELDRITARLAQGLYPSAKIVNSGFQDYEVPSGYFDLVIGNPPFGSQPTRDDAGSPYSGWSIHNYFFAKSIDKLRPGGLMVMVVSHNFLDKIDPKVREWIGTRAKMVGAARLPNDAFKGNAGTEVTTDVVIFQKLKDGEAPGSTAWLESDPLELRHDKTGREFTANRNRYFTENPNHILGQESGNGKMYSRDGEYTVEPTGGADLEDKLIGWEISLPEAIYEPVQREADKLDAVDAEIPEGVKVGNFFIGEDGEVYQRTPDVAGNRQRARWVPPVINRTDKESGEKTPVVNEGSIKRMRAMIGLREALRTQMRNERTDAPEAAIESGRKALNALYDAFVKEFGFLNAPTNRRVFSDDTEAALLQSLEREYDAGVSADVAKKNGIEPRKASAAKADILSRRVLFAQSGDLRIQSARDALVASLNDRGRLDMDYMIEKYGKPMQDIVQELGEAVYEDPVRGWTTADDYLSGDVKTKLAEAQAAVRGDSRFERNVQALEKVIPEDLMPSQIHASLGAAWVPPQVYKEFAREVTGGDVSFTYMAPIAKWAVAANGRLDPAKNEDEFGTDKRSALDLIDLLMQGRGVEVKYTVRNPDGTTSTVTDEPATEAARAKQDAIRAKWESWIWSDSERAADLAALYNDRFNRFVERSYDGSFLTLPGKVPDAVVKLDPHQLNVIWRAIQERNVLLDHTVGAGKTFAKVAIAMEFRRLGIARKPLFVVPNHLTLQWRDEFYRLYPAANILAATPEDFSGDNRKRLFSKIATGDWDAVIIGHSSLAKLELPEGVLERLMDEQISEISDAIEELKRERGDKNVTRDMQRIKENLEAKLKKMQEKTADKDKVVNMADLGVDGLFLDEAHEFKNLYFTTSMQRVAGLGNPAGSGKAFDLFAKIQWMWETFGENAPLVTATGTPVSNSLTEMFTVQRYMRYPQMRREGLHLFDAWAKHYGDVQNVYEVAPSGVGYRLAQRFAKFKNLPALMARYRAFADVIDADDLKQQRIDAGLRPKTPRVKGGRPENIIAPRSPLQTEYFGVPKLQRDEAGNPVFDLDPAQSGVEQDEKNQRWYVTRDGQRTGEGFTTEEDARLSLVERSLTPATKLDENSLLGKFANLKELTRQSKGKINALSLTSLANKAGLDYRIIDPAAPDFAGSKINQAVQRAMDIYRRWDADKGTQLIFLDSSVPASARARAATKEKRVFVRDLRGELTHAAGTLNTVPGLEGFPFYVVKEKDKTFAAFDPVTGTRLASGAADKQAIIDRIAKVLATDEGRTKWIDMRETAPAITDDLIEQYREDNGLETDAERSNEITATDVEGVSGASQFSVYDDMKAKLMARGVPESEIAFIHDYETPKAKQDLFAKVNRGEVRFLFGSTPKMGAGTNVQKRLVALHHIDAPWRPSDLEQREGRIIRQGNTLYERDPDGFEVEVLRYATEQTYDTRRWQLIEHKANGVNQLRKYDGQQTEIEDIEGEAANAADMKAAASGNPLILVETQLRNEVRRLSKLRDAHSDSQSRVQSEVNWLRRYIEVSYPYDRAELERLIARRDAAPFDPENPSILSEAGKRIEGREGIIQELNRWIGGVLTLPLGSSRSVTYRGLKFSLERTNYGLSLRSDDGATMDQFGLTDPVSSSGMLTRFANYANKLEDRRSSLDADLRRRQQELDRMTGMLGRPFEDEATLATVKAKHSKVVRALAKAQRNDGVTEQDRPVVEAAVETRKRALQDAGYGDALSEFERDSNATNAGDISAEFGLDDAKEPKKDEPPEQPALFSLPADEADGFAPAAMNDDREAVMREGRALVGELFSTWRNAPAYEVVNDVSELPPSILALMQQQRAFDARGLVHEGKAYFILSNNESLTALESTVFHEVWGHVGLRNRFGLNATPALAAIFDAIGGLDEFRAFARRHGFETARTENQVGFARDGRLQPMSETAQKRVLVEELVAKVQEAGGRDRTLARRAQEILGAIRNWLRKHGFVRLAKFNDADLAYLVKQARDAIVYGDGAVIVRDGAPPVFSTPAEQSEPTDVLFSLPGTDAVQRFAGQARDPQTWMKPAWAVWDRMRGAKEFGFLDRSVHTQLHKASKNAGFRRTFEGVLRFMTDASRMALRPAALAPTVLPRMDVVDGFKPALQQLIKGQQATADIEAAFGAVLRGTLAGEDANPKQGVLFDTAEAAGLTPEQFAIYKEFRASIDASLRELSNAEAWRSVRGVLGKNEAAVAKRMADDPARGMQTLTEALQLAADGIQAQIDKAVANFERANKDFAATKGNALGVRLDMMAEIPPEAISPMDARQIKAITDLSGKFDQVVQAMERRQTIEQTARELMEAGYAPLMRFGAYSVTMTRENPDSGEREVAYFSSFETAAERDRVADQLRADAVDDPTAEIAKGTMSETEWEQFKGVSPETVMLFAKEAGIDADDVMQAWYAKAVAQSSALTRKIHRKGIAGFSADGSRVLASFLTSNGRRASTLYNTPAIESALDDSNFRNADGGRQGVEQDEARRLWQYVQNPQEEAQGIRALMFFHFLGGSISNFFLNLTQPAMVAMPYISQMVGVKRSAALMAKAYKWVPAKNADQLPEDLRAAIERAENEGELGAQEAAQLYAEAGRPLAATFGRFGRGAETRARAFMELWGAPFAVSEHINRKATFIAAYMAAKESGSADPYTAAVEANRQSNFLYSKAGRPNWARGSWGSVIFTFKQFSISYVELIVRMLRESPESRKAALFMLGMLFLMSGLNGLPFGEDLDDLLDTAAQAAGYNFNSKAAKREALESIAGKTVAEVMLNGVSSLSPLDLQGRMSLGNIIPGTALLKPSESSPMNSIKELGGPVIGLAEAYAGAAKAVMSGDVRGLVAASPKAARDVIQGGEMLVTGEAVDKQGRKVADVSPAGALAKVAGFTPTDVQSDARRRREMQSEVALVKQTEARIAQKWAQGVVDGNRATVEEARAEMAEWNAKNPDSPIRISPAQVLRRAQSMRQDANQRFVRSASPDMRRAVEDNLQDQE